MKCSSVVCHGDFCEGRGKYDQNKNHGARSMMYNSTFEYENNCNNDLRCLHEIRSSNRDVIHQQISNSTKRSHFCVPMKSILLARIEEECVITVSNDYNTYALLKSWNKEKKFCNLSQDSLILKAQKRLELVHDENAARMFFGQRIYDSASNKGGVDKEARLREERNYLKGLKDYVGAREEMKICLEYAKQISNIHPSFVYQSVPVCHACHKIYSLLDVCRNRYWRRASLDPKEQPEVVPAGTAPKRSKTKEKLYTIKNRNKVSFTYGDIFEDISSDNTIGDNVIVHTHRRVRFRHLDSYILTFTLNIPTSFPDGQLSKSNVNVVSRPKTVSSESKKLGEIRNIYEFTVEEHTSASIKKIRPKSADNSMLRKKLRLVASHKNGSCTILTAVTDEKRIPAKPKLRKQLQNSSLSGFKLDEEYQTQIGEVVSVARRPPSASTCNLKSQKKSSRKLYIYDALSSADKSGVTTNTYEATLESKKELLLLNRQNEKLHNPTVALTEDEPILLNSRSIWNECNASDRHSTVTEAKQMDNSADPNNNNDIRNESRQQHPLFQKLRRVISEYDVDGRKTGNTYLEEVKDGIDYFISAKDAPVLSVPSVKFFFDKIYD